MGDYDSRFSRRFYRPEDATASMIFKLVMEPQFAHWQWARRLFAEAERSAQAHPALGKTLDCMSLPELREAELNGELLLLALEQLSPADLRSMAALGARINNGETLGEEIDPELVKRIGRVRHATWLMGRETRRARGELLAVHDGERLFDDQSDKGLRELWLLGFIARGDCRTLAGLANTHPHLFEQFVSWSEEKR